MVLHNLSGRARGGYTTFGCVWDKGEVKENSFLLLDQQERVIPVQSGITAYWPDGSVKWSAHTADSTQMGEQVKVVPKCEAEHVEAEVSGIKFSAIKIREQDGYYDIDAGKLALRIPSSSNLPASYLAEDVSLEGIKKVEKIYPVFCLEHRREENTQQQKTVQEYGGKITSVEMEQSGPLQAVFCFKGKHVAEGEPQMPFIIRMFLWSDSREIKFVHTFLYDGKEERDFMKGMGIRFDTCLTGKSYQHHVQFLTDKGIFHEAAVLLLRSLKGQTSELFRRQLQGTQLDEYEGTEAELAAGVLPVWDRYSLCQDSVYHYAIGKQTAKECCELKCLQGKHARGVMAVSGADGGIVMGMRDFWQKYPSGLEANGISEGVCQCTAWFHSPDAESYDFRHYATRSFPYSCYEGFEEVGASAYGIGVTSECRVLLEEKLPNENAIESLADRVQKPAVYVGSPEYYYGKRAFGYWSLPQTDTDAEQWLENQLEKAFEFYRNEVEKRDWYGLFDYGDIMHSYDAVRNIWMYDVGGFAWQNTELIPTYWLWLYFLRTGREDVFTMAEAMSRHCSEVDIYHFGPLKGLGSRHNVRHWGCSCKEPRISMAGHYRFLYYLTGDLRLGDIMWDSVDADHTMANVKHYQETLEDGSTHMVMRSGPDWSSLVSNWMTAYERTLNEDYRKKIEQGIADIAATPFGLASGPDFYYDVSRAHLIYHGEIENTPNQHLQICMGGVQIWLETADVLENDTLRKLMADLGSIYFLSKEEKAKLTQGKIVNRPFNEPMFATGVTAYAALQKQDSALAGKTWNILISELQKEQGKNGFAMDGIYNMNRTSQWCLNVMMCMEFIRDCLKDIEI